jgi:hypothetical protein
VKRAELKAVAFAVGAAGLILAVIAVALWLAGPVAAPSQPTTPTPSTVNDECRVEMNDPAGWPVCEVAS